LLDLVLHFLADRGLLFRLAWWEVHGMDGASRASLFALAARLALLGVDVGEVATHLNSLERAGLEALLAAYAAHVAVLDDQGALVGVGASHIDTAVVLATGTNLDDATGTGLGAHAAAHALVGVNDGQTRDGVDVQCIEIASAGAVAQAETAFRAATFASVQGIGESANLSTFVMHLGRRVLARAVAAHHRYHRRRCIDSDVKYFGHFLHVGAGAVKASQTVLVGHRLDASLSKVTAAGITAAAAVGTSQHSLNLVDERVLLHFELLCHKIKYHGQDSSHDTQYNKSGNQIIVIHFS